MSNLFTLPGPVILFDGLCNLCTGSVQFIIRHDPRHQFRFAALQSDFGQQVMKEFNLPTAAFGSFILLKEGKIYTRSSGALLATRKLNGAWPLLYAFMIVPPFIRNTVYNWIAKNRYKWFGKKKECWIPTPELNSLFIS